MAFSGNYWEGAGYELDVACMPKKETEKERYHRLMKTTPSGSIPSGCIGYLGLHGGGSWTIGSSFSGRSPYVGAVPIISSGSATSVGIWSGGWQWGGTAYISSSGDLDSISIATLRVQYDRR